MTSSPLAGLAIGAGIALFMFAALLDVLDAIMDEQAVEFASIFSLLCGFTVIALGDLARGGLGQPATGDDVSGTARQFSVTGADAARQPQGKL